MKKPVCIKYNYAKSKYMWLCEECFNKVGISQHMEIIKDYNPDVNPHTCAHCGQPFLSLNELKKYGKKKRSISIKTLKEDLNNRKKYLSLLEKIEIGKPIKIKYKRKWVAAIPLEFIEKKSAVRLAIIARKPARQYGDSLFYYSSKLPESIEPLNPDELPTFIGCNETEWLEKLLRDGI